MGALTTGTATKRSLDIRSQDQNNLVIQKDNPTTFIHACMTLPYRNYSFERALEGIKQAGYDHVAWGTQHRDSSGNSQPVLDETAPPRQAAELAKRCRNMGLEPVQMFSTVYPDHDDAVELLTNRIKQAAAAKLDYVLIFGPTNGGDPKLWIERFKQLAPVAEDNNVTLAIKQHGGRTTGTGQALSKIINEVNHPNIWMSYDAGNVLWYEDVNPIDDIQTCTELIRAFCLKDCRSWPSKTTSGPGFGEIDHYRLFAPVAFTGKTITLTYENIFASYTGMPDSAEDIDQLAGQSKIYMEHVIAGIQHALTADS